MKLADNYDWIVLGDHPGALLSAGLVAKLGLSVLILPLGSSFGLTLSKSGQVLDPESNYIIGLTGRERAQGLLADCLNRLGMMASESDLIQRTKVISQIMSPNARVTFNTIEDHLRFEFQREFGQKPLQATGLLEALRESELEFLNFWQQLPSRLTLKADKEKATAAINLKKIYAKLRRSRNLSQRDHRLWFSNKALGNFRIDSGFEDILKGFWYTTHASASNHLTRAEFIHALALARTGAPFKGGLTAYRDFLLRLAVRLGAHSPAKAVCRRIFVENGRFVGIQMSNKGSMVTGRAAVLGCSLDQAKEKLSLSGRSLFRRLKSAPTPTGWKFTIALTVHQDAIPPGTSERMVWQERGAPVLEVEIAKPFDYNTKEQDRRIIFLRTIMPFTQESLSTDFQRLTAARMLRRLTELIPFLEFHIMRIYPDFRGTLSLSPNLPDTDRTSVYSLNTVTDELAEIYGFAMPDLIPDSLRCFSSEGVGSSSGIEGLYVASGESFPKLGSFGGTVAAIEATASAAHRSGLAGPFV